MTTTSPPGVDAGLDNDRAYWRRVLAAGGSTSIPRWSLDPVAGVAEHEAPVPADIAAAVRHLAHVLGVPLRTTFLTAHAAVLAALSGEHDVTTGYVAGPDRQPLPCRLATQAATWRDLALDVHRVESELLSHSRFAVDALRHASGDAGPLFETVFDPKAFGPKAFHPGDDAGHGPRGLPDDVVLQVGVSADGDRLRLRYRTEAIDADCAARIAGYHLAALGLMAADPDAEHARQSLLGPEELRFQLEGLAGPHRDLPDRRFHELFEEQVRAHPDAVAAVRGDRRWTYRELNSRANRLGRALLARGLEREGVVAVVTERTLDWMAAVLAIFKAGGVYLPIEPHFPADRIARTLARAGCRLVLTAPESTATLRGALDTLPGVRTLYVDTAYAEDHPDGDLDLDVAPDQLAYIYFTSGSTGEPKGAMCEHAGMLNHLFAKIDDLGIAEGTVVAQVAPQCFDISLWQLVSGLAVGGQTLLIEQEVILDVPRFVAKIVEGRVGVLQVVPSYLEAVLSYLEQHPRDLPDLRVVSATGEALKKELTQRWFAARPGIKLVNAYGLTETSDDTNHEVMQAAPVRDRVPLGPCVNNVRVYVVDENLSPVPLGAPGLIVFSGVCVGRGYINDPERTAQHYLTDPHRPGERLYRGGDYGRWLPEGKLDFLGRRDHQVKISGFRIEIGEIENTLLRIPGISDGAVVVTERAGRSKRLIAFYSGPQPLEVEILRRRVGTSLPEYMVPATFHRRDRLPLTANGKIDRKALTALAAELEDAGTGPDGGDGGGFEAPSTATEQKLAAAWADVLGLSPDQISRHDHFFDRGGTSLAAVKLAIALKRAVSLKDLTLHPVLADLAALVDSRSGPVDSRSGPVDSRSEPVDSRSEPRPGTRGQRRSSLLQPLSEPDGEPAATLVCFPYAGGNAVNFQQMARALRGREVAVQAVELPGHDLAAEHEPFAPMSQVVEQVVAEIIQQGRPRVLLWGHSSGAAFAVATAKALVDRGIDVPQVLVAAQLIGTAAGRRAAADELMGRSNAELAAALSSDRGYTDLGQLDAQRAEHIGAAYRHDCVSAHRYLADALETQHRGKLSAPVTVVVAADDPSTAGYPDRYRDWELLVEHVVLQVLPDGGHYFLRSRPDQAAQAVLRAATALLTS